MAYKTLALGDFQLESGEVLRDARLAYQTHGALNTRNANAVLLPSFITGNHDSYLPFIGPGRCFDPSRHFVIATNLFGNGFSTSPSNAVPAQSGPDFPQVSIRDNVCAQHELVTRHLGVEKLALVAGFSMGALQAFQWAVSYPDRVERLAPWCGHARTTPHTAVFLGALRAVLEVASDWRDGRYEQPPLLALQALARVYAPWGLSQAWYRREGWRALGFPTLGDFLAGFWESGLRNVEACDYLAQVNTWMGHDVGSSPGHSGHWRQALNSVKALTVVMPSTSDLYFTQADAAAEAACIPGARLIPIESDWGHFAGIGIDPASSAQIEAAITRLLGDAPAA